MDRLPGKYKKNQPNKKPEYLDRSFVASLPSLCCLSFTLEAGQHMSLATLWGWEGKAARRGLVWLFMCLGSWMLLIPGECAVSGWDWMRGVPLLCSVGKEHNEKGDGKRQKSWWHYPGGDFHPVAPVLIGRDWRQQCENLWKVIGLLAWHT